MLSVCRDTHTRFWHGTDPGDFDTECLSRHTYRNLASKIIEIYLWGVVILTKMIQERMGILTNTFSCQNHLGVCGVAENIHNGKYITHFVYIL